MTVCEPQLDVAQRVGHWKGATGHQLVSDTFHQKLGKSTSWRSSSSLAAHCNIEPHLGQNYFIGAKPFWQMEMKVTKEVFAV